MRLAATANLTTLEIETTTLATTPLTTTPAKTRLHSATMVSRLIQLGTTRPSPAPGSAVGR